MSQTVNNINNNCEEFLILQITIHGDKIIF